MPPSTAPSFDARTYEPGHAASSSKSLGLAKFEVNSKTWPITTSPLNYRISVLRVQIDSQHSRANRSPNYRLMPASLSSPTATSPITTSTLNPHVNIEYKQCTVASSSRKVTSHKGRTSHRRTAEAREKRYEENYKRRVEYPQMAQTGCQELRRGHGVLPILAYPSSTHASGHAYAHY